jgi:hypothetical protein
MRKVSQVGIVLHHSFFMLRTAPESLAVPVMNNVMFAPNLRELASQAVALAKVKSASETFNGLHLRVEEDVTRFIAKVRAPLRALPCVIPLLQLSRLSPNAVTLSSGARPCCPPIWMLPCQLPFITMRLLEFNYWHMQVWAAARRSG